MPGLPLEYPYSLEKLQVDVLSESGGKTIISTKVDPFLFRQSPFYTFPLVIDPQPEFDPAVEVALLEEPVQEEQGYVQRWTVREKTLAEIQLYLETNPPTPKWVGFGVALNIESVNDLIRTLGVVAPTLQLMLGVGLGDAAKGDPKTFIGAWTACFRAGLLSQEVIDEVTILAANFDLPVDFIDTLNPK